MAGSEGSCQRRLCTVAPVGTVAPLIGMDKKCYKAETRLVEILEEKHIDAPENVLIQWKSLGGTFT